MFMDLSGEKQAPASQGNLGAKACKEATQPTGSRAVTRDHRLFAPEPKGRGREVYTVKITALSLTN